MKKKMSIRHLVAMTCVAVLLLLSGCGEKEETTNVLADGILTVAMIDGNDNYAKKDGEQFVGIEADILTQYGQTGQISISYKQASSTEEAFTMLNTGDVDLIMSRIAKSDDYMGQYLTTSSYGSQGLYYVTEKNNYVNTLAIYSGDQIGVSTSIPSQLLHEVPYIEKVVQLNVSDLSTYDKLISTEVVKGILCTEREVLTLLDNENLQIQQLPNSPREKYVAVMQLEQSQLYQQLNQAIATYLDSQAAETVGTQE